MLNFNLRWSSSLSLVISGQKQTNKQTLLAHLTSNTDILPNTSFSNIHPLCSNRIYQAWIFIAVFLDCSHYLVSSMHAWEAMVKVCSPHQAGKPQWKNSVLVEKKKDKVRVIFWSLCNFWHTSFGVFLVVQSYFKHIFCSGSNYMWVYL